MKTNFSSTRMFACRMFSSSTSKQPHVLNLLTSSLPPVKAFVCQTPLKFFQRLSTIQYIFLLQNTKIKLKRMHLQSCIFFLLFFASSVQVLISWFTHSFKHMFFPNIPSSLPNPACFPTTSLNILAYPCTKPVFSSSTFQNAPLPQRGF